MTLKDYIAILESDERRFRKEMENTSLEGHMSASNYYAGRHKQCEDTLDVLRRIAEDSK